jgi:hypothetical protein
VNNRKQVLQGLQKAIEKKGPFTRPEWERLRGEWSGQTHAAELHPYCSVVMYWIDKKLARM